MLAPPPVANASPDQSVVNVAPPSYEETSHASRYVDEGYNLLPNVTLVNVVKPRV